MVQGEWVISRVFQKSGVGCSSAGAGGKKRLAGGGITNSYDVSSPSSVSLPTLLDPSDRESCSYDGGHGATAKEHVPCFSTTAALPSFNHHNNSLFELPPPPPSLSAASLIHDPSSSASRFPGHGLGGSAFPSLRSLQENLQMPFFFSAVAPPPPMHGGADQMSGYASFGQWPAPENQRAGATELDCMWRSF